MIVITWVSSSAGGAEMSIRTLASAFRSKGHRAVAVELRTEQNFAYPDVYQKGAYICYSYSDYENTIINILKSEKDKTIISNHRSRTQDANLAMRLEANLFVVVRATPVHAEEVRVLIGNSLEFIRWESYPWVDDFRPTYICPSKYVGSMIKMADETAKIAVIPNPIEDIWFSRDIDANVENRRNFHYISASRLVKWKRVLELSEDITIYLKNNTGTSFSIFGDGPERQKICQGIPPWAKQVFSVPGWHDSLWTIYPQGDAYLSYSEMEAFGRVGAEAMACGLPLIVPCVGGLGEMVTYSGVGVAFNPSNAGALCAALDQWGSMSEKQRSEKRALAKTYAKAHFSKKAVIEDYADLVIKDVFDVDA